MARTARLYSPGSLVHVISRLVNREFRLAGDHERSVYLDCLGRAAARTDWRVTSFCVMSSHTHLVAVAGNDPVARLLQPLHCAVAWRLNRDHQRFGPVFAERPSTLYTPPGDAARVLAYVHNNPERAKLVAAPGDASPLWTSHAYFTGACTPPPWLAVDLGLQLAGFDSTAAGRRAFDEWVRSRAADPRDARWSTGNTATVRPAVRACLRLPVELGAPVRERSRGPIVHALVDRSAPPVLPRWNGPISLLLARVCEVAEVSNAELLSTSRHRRVVRARRLALTTGTRCLRCSVSDVAAAMALSRPAASHLLARTDDVMPLAQRLADDLRALPGFTGYHPAEAGDD